MSSSKTNNSRQGKRGTRANRGNPRRPIYLSPALQEEIAAVTLLGIALLTALGAFNLSGGNVLDGWTHTLSILFGWGRLLAPLFFGGLGIWLLLDSLDLRPDVGWERPLGLVLLFLVLLTAFHVSLSGPTGLDAAQSGEGGGLVGYALSDSMVGAVGVAGTWLVLFIVLCIASILLFNVPLSSIVRWSLAGVHGMKSFIAGSIGAWSDRGRSRSQPGQDVLSEKEPSSGYAGRTTTPKPAAAPERRQTGERGAAAEIDIAPPRSAVAARIVGGDSADQAPPVHREWRLPHLPDILEETVEQEISAQEIRTKVRQIEETLIHFGVPAKVIEVNQGPAITQFGVEPGFVEQKAPDGTLRRTKIKVSRISALQHDLELALASAPVRVEAPVPGKAVVGIEVPNSQISLVSLRGVMESEEFKKAGSKSHLALALGQDVSGQPIVADLGSMPHLLIAGATGSGKSVCINALIACLLVTNTPDDLKFVMVDPKRVELSAFNGIPHLLTPVVVEMNQAVAALQRAVQAMDERFKKFAQVGARNIETYHQITQDRPGADKLPYLVLVVDELADLMMVAPDEVEKAITRLAQMARATGIHLVLATQRPSVDVVTGLIKANFPSRISFAVTSQIDSRVVLDSPGAEKLLGRGDMLYMASDSSKLLRLQGCFVSDRELESLVTYWKGFVGSPADKEAGLAHAGLESPPGIITSSGNSNLPLARVQPSGTVYSPPELSSGSESALWNDLASNVKTPSEEDELLAQAIEIVQSGDRASVSLLQRKLRIGYSRAAKLIDLMEAKGIVGADEGAKGRAVLKNGTNAAAAQRQFEGLEEFDDWTEDDWADLDKA